MAKNPKIEFYKIILSPSREQRDITFRDVLLKKEILQRDFDVEAPVPIADNQIMPFLLQSFIADIDGVAKINQTKRKAFYIKQNGQELINRSITPLFERNIIYGKIKGGSFDTGKYLDEIQNPGDGTEALGLTKLLSDDFYFLLYTPLNKRRGILIVQTYTQDSIVDVFKPFIENLFKVSGISNKAVSSIFMPEVMQNQFKEQSVVKKFEYKNEYILPAIVEEGLAENEFTINVTISSHGNQINLANLPAWKRVLGKTLFNLSDTEERQIDTFNARHAYIQGGFENVNQTRFSLDANNIEIKPTIFLNNFIHVEENGTPDWDELHDFALETLINIVIPEVYPEDYIV